MALASCVGRTVHCISALAAERGGRQAGVLCNRPLCKEVVSSVMWFSLLPRLPGHEDKLLTRSKQLLCRCILLEAGISLLLDSGLLQEIGRSCKLPGPTLKPTECI